MRSLYWKLGGALLLVVAVSVGLTAWMANVSTGREFQSYVRQGATMYAHNTANVLSQFHSDKGSWSGVQQPLEGMLRSAADRLVLADTSGSIVADTGHAWVGRNTADLGLTGGVPVAGAGGKPAGTLYLFISGGGGRGFMGGRSAGMPQAATPEQDFLTRINASLIVAGVVAAVVALLLGLLLTRQMVKPLRLLTEGARRIAAGNLAYRAVVRSRDEIGTLANSFNTMASSLQRSEESRRRLNADIAHELRTPLTIIEGTVDGIMDGVFQPDSHRLGAIKEQTALLTRLINDLRELSLAESGQLKLERQPVDMAALVRRKMNQIEGAAKGKGITLELAPAEGLPDVSADPGRVEQVISNLLTNALRHTPEGGAITAAVSKQGDEVLVTIADTGEGIAPDALPHIFERFYRVEASRSRNAGGTGLGLAIVKQMVEAHGGRVWAESQPGKGSAFHMALPVRQHPVT